MNNNAQCGMMSLSRRPDRKVTFTASFVKLAAIYSRTRRHRERPRASWGHQIDLMLQNFVAAILLGSVLQALKK